MCTWWLVAGSSEPDDYKFTQEGARGANKTTGGILRYTGADPNNPIGAFLADLATTADTSPIAPEITTTVANTTVLRIAGIVDGVFVTPIPGNPRFTIEARGSRPGLAASDVAHASAGSSTGTATFKNEDAELWRTLTIEIKPDAAPGTITLQKSVTASDGGAANNPASPDLSGFVFEIKDSGSVVVDTLTTNSSGTAVSIALPDGDYTVVETDSQGLSDSTGSTGVALDASGKTVNWENRQAALGMITVQKSVTASDGGTANNPASPDLSGFVFEIKDN